MWGVGVGVCWGGYGDDGTVGGGGKERESVERREGRRDMREKGRVAHQVVLRERGVCEAGYKNRITPMEKRRAMEYTHKHTMY